MNVMFLRYANIPFQKNKAIKKPLIFASAEMSGSII
jgi:hypothetical protein